MKSSKVTQYPGTHAYNALPNNTLTLAHSKARARGNPFHRFVDCGKAKTTALLALSLIGAADAQTPGATQNPKESPHGGIGPFFPCLALLGVGFIVLGVCIYCFSGHKTYRVYPGHDPNLARRQVQRL